MGKKYRGCESRVGTLRGLMWVIFSWTFGPMIGAWPTPPPECVNMGGDVGGQRNTIFEFHFTQHSLSVIFENFACVDDCQEELGLLALELQTSPYFVQGKDWCCPGRVDFHSSACFIQRDRSMNGDSNTSLDLRVRNEKGRLANLALSRQRTRWS